MPVLWAMQQTSLGSELSVTGGVAMGSQGWTGELRLLRTGERFAKDTTFPGRRGRKEEVRHS